jgi:hypothetical protein
MDACQAKSFWVDAGKFAGMAWFGLEKGEERPKGHCKYAL